MMPSFRANLARTFELLVSQVVLPEGSSTSKFIGFLLLQVTSLICAPKGMAVLMGSYL